MNFLTVLFGAMETSQIILIVLLVLMVVVLIVLPMFTNKKRQKQVNELHNSIQAGDVIKTVGGIIGKVVAVKELSPIDKEMVIETGEEGSKTTMVFDIQAVYQVISKNGAVPFDDITAKPQPEEAIPAEEPKTEPEVIAAADMPAETPAESAQSEAKAEETATSDETADKAAVTPGAASTKSATSKKTSSSKSAAKKK